MVEIVWDEDTGGYSWDTFYVYIHPDFPTSFVVHTDSGCSCYGYDELDERALRTYKPMTKAEVIDAYRGWGEYDVHSGRLEKLMEALNGGGRWKAT